MRRAQRILYIQHAGALGGSCMSLLYLIQGVDRSQYEPIVACIHPTPAVLALYREQGIETFYAPGIDIFAHTTAGWHPLYNPLAVLHLFQQLLHFWPSVRATERLLDLTQPDLVHLNSLVLAPSAVAVKRVDVPLVWHVRESVHFGHFGLRKRILSRLIMRLADEAIFISNHDRQQLTGGRKGVVIYNFVDFNRFDFRIDGKPVRAELGLSEDARVVLFLGGISLIKGVLPLLEALHLVKQQIPSVHCLMGGALYEQSHSFLAHSARLILPKLGSGTPAQRVNALLDRYRMRDYVHLLPFRQDVERLMAASDVVVFPSIEPHFARPVIEAGAMAKPVVASLIGGVEELVEDGVTGFLTPPGDVEALADALVKLITFNTQQQVNWRGENGYNFAKSKFDSKINSRCIMSVYETISQCQNG